MNIEHIECVLTSEPSITTHEHGQTIRFFAATKNPGAGDFNPYNSLNCTLRLTTGEDSSIVNALCKGKRVSLKGAYEPPAFLPDTDPSLILHVESITLVKKVRHHVLLDELNA